MARRYVPLFLCLALAFLTVFVWSAASAGGKRVLTVSFLDVGQGDAVLIESPSGAQVLIDGGANRAVLRELSKHVGWRDRSLDVVLATHPDADHIGGLPDVLSRFRVSFIGYSDVADDGADAQAFERAVEAEIREGATRRVLRRGDVLDLGGGAFLEVLFPDRPLPGVETNTGSLIVRVVYGKTAFLIGGDAPKATERYVASLDREGLRADVLKANHHGSKTSSDPLFVGFASPSFAVISRACDNSYGHPHAEVLALFARFGAEALDTCEEGTITFTSNGSQVSKQ